MGRVFGLTSLGFVGAVVLGFAATPALAQDDAASVEAEMDAMSAMMAQMFAVEPLTTEEEGRVPLATTIIAKMMPDGWYSKVMEDTVGTMLAPLMEMMGSAVMGVSDLSVATGLREEQLGDLSQDDRGEITALLDPNYGQRNGLMMDYMIGEMIGMMGEMEPAMRMAMSKAYARAFTAKELTDIASFYATPSGGVYAAKSMMLAADPQMMSVSAQMAPMVMERLPEIIANMENAANELPAERGFEDLSGDERQKLADLLGRSVDELRFFMTTTEEERANIPKITVPRSE